MYRFRAYLFLKISMNAPTTLVSTVVVPTLRGPTNVSVSMDGPGPTVIKVSL